MSGSRALQRTDPGRLPGAEVQLQPPRLGRQVRRGRRARARSARSPPSSRRSIAATSSSGWSRWRTRPTAGSPTRSTCSSSSPNLKIRAEVRLRVHHCLLGRCEWGQVRRVYSKAQALSQCRNWLGKNVPQATKVEVVSTAAAAELAQREEFAAAVASRAAAGAYRLERPGREHRGPAPQRHPVRRHRRARRASAPAATRPR